MTCHLLRRTAAAAACAVLTLMALPAAGRAQDPPAAAVQPGAPAAARSLSLEEAIALALQASEDVKIAQTDVLRAASAREQAQSQRWPQIFGALSYNRTLRSQFQGLGDDDRPAPELPPGGCDEFIPDPSQPLDTRVRLLEQAVRCNEIGAGGGFGSLVRDLPFGRENQWSFGFSVSQPLYTGGRIGALIGSAGLVRERAEINATSTRAQLTLDAAQAYFDALLGDRLVEISQAAIVQARRTLEQTVIMRKVGTRPEFDVLRARVALQGLQPSLIQQEAARDLAYIRLKQLLDVPLTTALTLTTSLDAPAGGPLELISDVQPPPVPERAPVREAARTVAAERLEITLARAGRLPDVRLGAQIQQLAYPSTIFPTSGFVSNWTVGLSAEVPIFTGGRISAEIADARAAFYQAELRFAQVQELAALDTADALLDLGAARASFQASAGTVTEAVEAYRIAEIRFREGLSTQVELTDAQLLLQQASANRAVAERDLRLAALRVRLLPELPLSDFPAAQPTRPTPPRQTTPAPTLQATPPTTLRATGGDFGAGNAAGTALQTGTRARER